MIGQVESADDNCNVILRANSEHQNTVHRQWFFLPFTVWNCCSKVQSIFAVPRLAKVSWCPCWHMMALGDRSSKKKKKVYFVSTTVKQSGRKWERQVPSSLLSACLDRSSGRAIVGQVGEGESSGRVCYITDALASFKSLEVFGFPMSRNNLPFKLLILLHPYWKRYEILQHWKASRGTTSDCELAVIIYFVKCESFLYSNI